MWRRALPVTEDTQFILCSVAESFTALGLAMLVDAGRLDWAKPCATICRSFTSTTRSPWSASLPSICSATIPDCRVMIGSGCRPAFLALSCSRRYVISSRARTFAGLSILQSRLCRGGPARRAANARSARTSWGCRDHVRLRRRVAGVRDRGFSGLMRRFPGRTIIGIIDHQLAFEIGQHDRGAILHVGPHDPLADELKQRSALGAGDVALPVCDPVAPRCRPFIRASVSFP